MMEPIAKRVVLRFANVLLYSGKPSRCKREPDRAVRLLLMTTATPRKLEDSIKWDANLE